MIDNFCIGKVFQVLGFKELFADVEAWMKDGLVDYLIPEIY